MNFLYHYGVKGMKWGVRKERETKGTGKKKTKSNLTKGEIVRAGSKMVGTILVGAAMQKVLLDSGVQTKQGATMCMTLISAQAIGGNAVSLYKKKKARENARNSGGI